MIAEVSSAMMWIGGLFCIVGALGFFRFPDFFTRIHASTVVTVGGVCLSLAGLLLRMGFGPVGAKISIIVAFLLFASPALSHALANAAYLMGIAPHMERDDLRKEMGIIQKRRRI